MYNACPERLFDAHCHIEPGNNTDRFCIVPGVAGRLLCGVTMDDWPAVAEAAAKWPGTVAAFGVHPWHAGETEEEGTCERLERLLQAHPEAWVGEIGLDALRADAAPARERQRELFARQLRLAARLGRRVNLHCVKAWEELSRELETEYLPAGGKAGFIVHSFAGPHQFIERLAEMGAYFSIGPLAWRRRSRKQEERVRRLPEERLLVESDAFLAPGVDAVDELRETLAWLARVRGTAADALGAAIAENAGRLLNDGYDV